MPDLESSAEALRDERVAAARKRLRDATTETKRADAICDELAALVAFERDDGGLADESAPRIAARLRVGELSVDRVVGAVSAAHSARATELVNELTWVLCARDWLALEARVPLAVDVRPQCAARIARERDIDGALLLVTADPPTMFVATLAAVSPFLTRAQLAPLRQRCLEELELLGELGDDREYFVSASAIARCLDASEQAPLVTALADRALSFDPGMLDTDYGRDDWRVDVLRTLLEANERAAADALFEWVSTNEDPAAPTPGPNLADALAVMLANETPEGRAALEARAFEVVQSYPEPGFASRALLATLRGEARERLVDRLRADFDAGQESMPPQILRPDQRERFWRRTLDELARFGSATTMLDAMDSDPQIADDLIAWTDFQFDAPPLDTPLESDALAPIGWLARDGCPAALRLLVLASADVSIADASAFYVGLGDDAVRAVLRACPAASRSTRERIADVRPALQAASAVVRDELWRALDVRSMSRASLEALAWLAPEDAIDSIVCALVQRTQGRRSGRELFTIDEPRVNEAVARWLFAAPLDEWGDAKDTAVAVAQQLGRDPAVAREALRRAYASIDEVPTRELPASLALERLRTQLKDDERSWDVASIDAWFVARVAVEPDAPAVLATAAARAIAALAEGRADPNDAVILTVSALVQHAPASALAPLETYAWALEDDPLARAVMLRCKALGRRGTVERVARRVFDAFWSDDELDPQRVFLLNSCAHPDRLTVAEAVDESIGLAFYEPLFDADEVARAGMCDELLDAFATVTEQQLDAAGRLWPHASDDARARAAPWVARALETASIASIPAPLAPLADPSWLVQRWCERPATTVAELCASPAVLQRMIGGDGLDRVAQTLIRNLGAWIDG
ncbi:MAG: hypothetical protein JNK05_38485 [Myxococcales bacterium]|nr:hypothetical protein [Myxococcales bacterium]